jgi:hypothetical protein
MLNWRLAVGLLALSTAGCGPGSDLQNPEEMILFSIDGRSVESQPGHRRGDGVPTAVGEFHGYPVLGKVEITDLEKRKQIVAALKEGRASKGEQAKCFWPRHAVRAVEKGHTVEYIICFQCGGCEVYTDGKRSGGGSLSFGRSVRPSFDRPLKDAGIPIAPE